MSAQPQARLTEQEYLALERAAEFKSDYFGGRMYSMAGGSFRHGQIIVNLAGELHAALKGGACSTISSDLRVRVSPGGLYTYPDVVVVCAEPKFADDQKDTLLNPSFIAEILSPSTELYDRGFKFAQYRTLDSLQEYALVSQDELRVEVYRRQGTDWLLSEYTEAGGGCRFASLSVTIPLADLYDRIVFGHAS